MIKTKSVQMIDVGDFDDLVTKTYGRPYSFQQQDGCKERGTFDLTVPCDINDFENDTVPEEINGDEMGVSFSAWLARDPKEWKRTKLHRWERNFYPTIESVANDLHAKGLLPAGEYVIDIDW